MQEITMQDGFGQAIARLTEGLAVGLEIGGGTGDGSTQCIRTKKLFSIENHPERKDRLAMNLALRGGTLIIGTAVVTSLWMNRQDIEEFYRTTPTNLNQYPIGQVLSWQEEFYKNSNHYTTNAIEDIAHDHKTLFDFALIDGCPFSAEAELRCLRPFLAQKAVVALDDVNDIKNLANYNKLKGYAELVCEDLRYRNGWAIFRL